MSSQRPLRRILTNRKRWLSIGLGVKRWLLVLGVGCILFGMGIVYLLLFLRQNGYWQASLDNLINSRLLPAWVIVLLTLVAGVVIILLAVIRLGYSFVAPFQLNGENLVESLYQHQRRNRGPRIVAIGGGTGLSTLLRGLTEYTGNITAIVTVADDGGSSGRLRRELGILPPGDLRNNIAALARDEALMTQLLQYRFGRPLGSQSDGESGLSGHAFGNLLLAALAGLTGSFEDGLLAAQRVLAIRGRVLPSTLDPVTLVAEIRRDGKLQRVEGESAIPDAGGQIERLHLQPEQVRAYPEAIRAILEADMIVIGPGSLYTSLLPNLLIGDLAGALQSSRARKVYVCNLAMQPGETDQFDVAAHVAVLLRYLDRRCVDLVLANSQVGLPPETGGGKTIFVQPNPPQELPMISADLVDEGRPWRHDSQKLAQAIMRLF